MNFIILYVPKSGSSALVDAFSRQPEIQVPLFEELDGDHHRWCRSRVLEVIEDLFDQGRQGAVANLLPHDFRRFMPSIRFKEGALHTCVKWRPFSADEWWTSRERMDWEIRLQEVLRERNVQPILLVRRGLLNHTLRSYFNDEYLTEIHPQFSTSSAEMSRKEYLAYREDVASIRFEVGRESWPLLASLMRNRLKYVYCLRHYARDFFSLPSRWLFTEDLFHPQIGDRALASAFPELGARSEWLVDEASLFRPSGLVSLSQCTNLEELRALETTVQLETAYGVLTGQIPPED